MAKIGKRLISVCSLAVTSVYAAGYIYTIPSAQANASSIPNLASPNPSQSTPGAAAQAYKAATPTTTKTHTVHHKSTASTHASTKSDSAKQSASASSTAKSTSKTAAASAALYKDGVYTGVGSNPYGSLALSVTIAKGKIASVVINQYNMHYSQSVIDPQLPQEAVSMQTWRIYIVSGATASTYNFAEAMYQALQKAKV